MMATGTRQIRLTQTGQPHPYADLEYAGTVEAASEQEARSKLAKMRGVDMIHDRQQPEDWHLPYFQRFAQVANGVWDFWITEAYTG